MSNSYGPLPGFSGGGSGNLFSYKGTYDASTNTPTLTNGTGTTGDWYYVVVAGTNNPTGQNLAVGDGIAYNGSIWQKVPGAVLGDTDDVPVAAGYVVVPSANVAAGQTTTYALGALQGGINAIRSPVGILKSNGSVVSAAVPAVDYVEPSGNVATATALQTARMIYGNSFNGTADLTQVIASTYGGTGNGFTKFSGATASEKTYALPDASCAILTDNALVTVPQGGTGVSSIAAYSVVIGGTTNTGAIQTVSGLGTADQILTSQGPGLPPIWANSPASTGGIDPYIATRTYDKGMHIAGDGTNGILGAIYVALVNGITGAFNISDWGIDVGLDLDNYNTYSATFSTANTVTGQYNTFNGYNAGTAPSLTGNFNVAFGPFAFTSNSTISGQKNAGFGGSTANGGITSASFNTWCGFGAFTSATTANYNVCMGYAAGSNVDSGNANILIGDLGTSGGFDNNLRISNPQNNNEIIVVNNTDQPVAANMVLASPVGSAGPLSPRQLTASDILSYSQAFNATTDWGAPSGGLYTISIPSVTHGQGVNVVNVQIFETSGSNLILTTVNQVIIDSTNGDVSFNVPDTPDARFAGKIFIIGAA